MKERNTTDDPSRRRFLNVVSTASVGAVVSPTILKSLEKLESEGSKTNIDDALKFPINKNSMPGKYPGKVVKVFDSKSITDAKFDKLRISKMLSDGMLKLTGNTSINKAWLEFVSPDDIIGLKVNPAAGIALSTNVELTQAIVEQLEDAGIPRKNIVLWDRRKFDLGPAGFTEENFPGIDLDGTEVQDSEGSFYDKSGKLYSEDNIDKDWYYMADVEGEYSEKTLPYMINGGKFSYFSKICTQKVTKIINIPIMKNAGNSVTLSLKNLAYGAISNTGRLHKEFWAETCAEVNAFPPLRDKVVLNIVDCLKGCYQGGPGANPKYFFEPKSLIIGSDPVAVDRIGYEMILKKRIEENIQEIESDTAANFLKIAEKLKLGIADRTKIKLETLIQS